LYGDLSSASANPGAYVQLADLNRLPSTVSIEPKPVLLGALLKETGIKAPAAMPAKRLHLYRQCAWLAKARGIPFVMPPRHPFSSSPALRLLCSLGPTMDHVRLAHRRFFSDGRAVRAQGQRLPAGVRREIWIRGIGLMPGYFRDPEATQRVMKPGGWYASGDLG
jgi:2-hydroxychromene-2-carboxylate isomerase